MVDRFKNCSLAIKNFRDKRDRNYVYREITFHSDLQNHPLLTKLYSNPETHDSFRKVLLLFFQMMVNNLIGFNPSPKKVSEAIGKVKAEWDESFRKIEGISSSIEIFKVLFSTEATVEDISTIMSPSTNSSSSSSSDPDTSSSSSSSTTSIIEKRDFASKTYMRNSNFVEIQPAS